MTTSCCLSDSVLPQISSDRPSAPEVCGVDEVAAGFEKAADEVERGLLVAPPTLGAERHGAEAELRDPQTAAT
jgi:hypothetical protein